MANEPQSRRNQPKQASQMLVIAGTERCNRTQFAGPGPRGEWPRALPVAVAVAIATTPRLHPLRSPASTYPHLPPPHIPARAALCTLLLLLHSLPEPLFSDSILLSSESLSSLSDHPVDLSHI